MLGRFRRWPAMVRASVNKAGHMRRLVKLHDGPHLYGPGGKGWVALDVTQFVPEWTGGIQRSLEMPGFVEGNVTYESHRFWLHFYGKARMGGALIVVNHGGGWEVWGADYRLAETLARYGDDTRGLFHLCWVLREISEEAEKAGAAKASQRYRKAFVDGRLKKRKMPGRDAVKVWIEPEATPALRAA